MVNSIEEITIQLLITYFLVFCRVGACIMTMPGIGEVYVSSKIRILVALILTIIIGPMVSENFLNLTDNPIKLTIQVFNELFIGIGIGMFIKIILSTVSITGIIISSNSGLSSAMLFDPNTGSQGTVEGNFLSALTVVLIFISDMHHQFIGGIINSYTVFKALSLINFQDVSEDAAKLISQTFLIAFKMASPHIVIGCILMFSSGLLSRLMPNMQIYFLLMPVQILLSFSILAFSVTSIMFWYFNYLSDTFVKIFS